MLNQASQRAVVAKQIVADSERDGDPRDVLSKFDRDILGAESATLRIPLRDPVELDRHLDLLIGNLHNLRASMAKLGKDRSALFLARSTIRELNRKINAYRSPRRG